MIQQVKNAGMLHFIATLCIYTAMNRISNINGMSTPTHVAVVIQLVIESMLGRCTTKLSYE